tara:strand:- start:1597 stop:1875 length:279 start_codon:yes stop_codon:yes gene_type:complete
MKFEPRNRFILLEEIKLVEEDKSAILLPQEYKVKTNPHGVYRISNYAKDCTKIAEDDLGKLVVVNDAMVEGINAEQGVFLIILENYVYGILD